VRRLSTQASVLPAWLRHALIAAVASRVKIYVGKRLTVRVVDGVHERPATDFVPRVRGPAGGCPSWRTDPAPGRPNVVPELHARGRAQENMPSALCPETCRMKQIIRELKRQAAGAKLEPEQLKGLIRAGYVYRNGEEHLLTGMGREALTQAGADAAHEPPQDSVS
jgi:hypothetical protein